MATKQLKKITQEEFDYALNNHFFYQKGDESKRMVFKDCDFSGVRIGENDLSGAIFDGSDFSGASSYGNSNYGKRVFYYCTLDNASFRDCKLTGIDFSGVHSMNGAILIGAEFQPRTLGGFDNQIIATNEQLQELLSKSEKVIEKQEEVIKEKDEKLEKTSEKQSKGMLDIFLGLNKDFLKEELSWLFVASVIALFLVVFFSMSIARLSLNLSWLIVVGVEGMILLSLYMLSLLYPTDAENTKKIKMEWSLQYFLGFIKKIWNSIVFILLSILVFFIFSPKINSMVSDFKNVPFCHPGTESSSVSSGSIVSGEVKIIQCINKDEYILIFSPLIFLFISLLWFSVHQYGRAKKLRIEQQNKQAMIYYMQAVIAQDGKGAKDTALMPQLAPFFANAIIHRPFSQENYEPQLPVDTLFRMAKDTKDIIK